MARGLELVHQFEDPVPGMTTLRDAADHIQKLPPGWVQGY